MFPGLSDVSSPAGTWFSIMCWLKKLRDGKRSPSFHALGRGSCLSTIGFLFVLSLESDLPRYIWMPNPSPQARKQGGEAAFPSPMLPNRDLLYICC